MQLQKNRECRMARRDFCPPLAELQIKMDITTPWCQYNNVVTESGKLPDIFYLLTSFWLLIS